jgi:hypothetical protein
MVVLCFSLAVGEFAAPLFHAKEKTEQEYVVDDDHPTTFWRRSHELGAQGTTGVHAIKKRSLSGETVFDVKYSTGRDGFRITPGAGCSGSLGINFLGDSLTFGEGVQDDETLPYFIFKNLKTICVRNLGFPAYGVHQVLSILQSDRDTRSVMNFLLTAPWQAVRSSCKPTWTQGSPKYKLLSNGAVARVGRCFDDTDWVLLRRFLSHSAIYGLYERFGETALPTQILICILRL